MPATRLQVNLTFILDLNFDPTLHPAEAETRLQRFLDENQFDLNIRSAALPPADCASNHQEDMLNVYWELDRPEYIDRIEGPDLD